MSLEFGNPVWLAPTGVSTVGAGLYQIKTTLKAAGWTVQASGDGGAIYGSSSDVITHGGTGANGFNVVNAWARLRDPGGVREIVMQVVGIGTGTTTADAAVRIWQSPSARFSGGSPSATVAPTAADSQVVLNGIMLWRFNAGSCSTFGGADQNAPYGFYFVGMGPVSNFSPVMGFAMFPIISVRASDTDPVVWYAAGGSGGTIWTGTLGGDGAISDADKCRAQIPGGGWAGFSGVFDAGTYAYVNTFDAGTFVPAIAQLFVDAADDVAKGWAINLAVSADSETTHKRTYSDADGNANVYIRANDCLLPWNGTVPSGWANNGVVRILTDYLVVAPEPTPPVITMVTPANMSELTRFQPITFRITDDEEMGDVYIWIKYKSDTYRTIVSDGTLLRPPFDTHSTRIATGITQLDYSILPEGGWRDEVEELRIRAFDTSGAVDEE